ncbi:1,4-alpha-glucan branching enzyme, partial [Paenibacillus sp. 28ISP30-2]|nr:1,4-alpha-glucan branching enzyme [Paenibacillus sp. 28ISP30-2]
DRGQSGSTYLGKGKKPGDTLVIPINFQPVAREHYRMGLEKSGSYIELLNSDHSDFGGSGQLNTEVLRTTKIPCHGQLHSLEVTIPPLSVVILKKASRRAKKVD